MKPWKDKQFWKKAKIALAVVILPIVVIVISMFLTCWLKELTGSGECPAHEERFLYLN